MALITEIGIVVDEIRTASNFYFLFFLFPFV
jgi:hypothetical protein